VFAKVLAVVVDVGAATTASRLTEALRTGEPILLALRPQTAPPVPMAADALPVSLRDVVVEAPSLHDFDHALGGVA
jgi:hypothetical protein